MPIKSLSQSSLTNFQKYSSFLAGNAAYSPGSYDLIESEILTSSQASVTMTSGGVWANYQHLQIRISGAESTRASSQADTLACYVNSDTGSNYSRHRIRGNGSSVSSSGFSSDNMGFAVALTSAGSSPSGVKGNGITDLLDINNTNKYTTAREFRSIQSSTTNLVDLGSGAWLNTDAVTSLTFYCSNGNINTGTRFSIYGLKAA